jgi:Ca2+-binding EF-hand superfamily protein
MLSELPEGSEGLNFTLFLAMMGDRMQGTDSEADLLHAFEALDEDRTGNISVTTLREYLTTVGDRLTEDEFDMVLRGVELNSKGHVDYRQFVKTLTLADLQDQE